MATGTMFGAGTLAVVDGAAQLVRKNADRDALVALLGTIAPGNGLVVAEETESGKKDPPARALADGIRAMGGEVRRLEAPREGGLAAWIEARARERGIALGPGRPASSPPASAASSARAMSTGATRAASR